MSAKTHLFDADIRRVWFDARLAYALDKHARWFLFDNSLWEPARTGTIYRAKRTINNFLVRQNNA